MNSRKYIIRSCCICLLLILSYYIYLNVQPPITINTINNNLKTEDINFGMNEQEVINYWGSGEYIEGFGGYGRYYSDRHVMISFSNDKENSMYGKVSSIYFSNPQYSIFSVKIGDKKNEGINKLKSNRFKPVNYADDTFERGEFSISLRGKNDINYIQILYNDKDLRDRNY